MIDKDFSSLFSINFNKDSRSDLLLYNSQKKNLISLTGDIGGSFTKKNKYQIPFEITNLYNITQKKDRLVSCAFTSRKSRAIGVYEFTSSGRPVLKSVVKFDSYPENLSVDDIDGKGGKSILVSGSAFNGLALLSPDKNKRLKETKIVNNQSYENSIFADITNDGFPDIIAANILSRSLDFFYNNGSGVFNKIRSININEKINSLQSFDMNLDQYTDLIYSSGNSINIIYGDSVGSFKSQFSIKTINAPDKIIFGDFNSDGSIDIAYINKKDASLSLLFSKGDGTFYPEIIYLKKNGISDLIPFYSKFISGISLISSEGHLYTITNLSSVSEDVSLTFGAKPGAITFFDMENNGIIDIAFIDNNTNSLKLIVRNNSGIPGTLYKVKLFEKHSRILVNNGDPYKKIFYCYSPGKKIIEVIGEDFKTGKIERNSLYTPGKINQVLNYSKGNNSDLLYVTYLNNSKLGVSIFDYQANRFVINDYPDIASNVFNTSLSFSKKAELFYWKTEDSSQVLYAAEFQNKISSPVKYFHLSVSDTTLINSFSGDILNKDEIVSINFFETPQNDFALISSLKKPSVIISKDLLNHFRIKNKNLLFFGELKPGGLKKLFVYVPDEGALHKVDFVNKGKEILIWKLLEAKNVESYFIKNMNLRSYHMVYSDSADDCIKIKQITQ